MDDQRMLFFFAALFLLPSAVWAVEPFFLLLWAVELLLRLVQLSFVEAVMARSISVYVPLSQHTVFVHWTCS